ncbi:hypothetical protein BC834DRAFT_229645 [Gloeopeniophorella convolvens]|nr:hypothetical protein BC834DRAFT_229645 [Gloeopeniophorella convolvens]
MPSNPDNITLVAPRPVRLANFSIHLPSPHRPHSLRITSAPAEPVDRRRSADGVLDDDPPTHREPDSISPKASPRASPRLQSEALEEFLSILRPSLFPPRSPTLRSLRYPVPSFHDRSLSLSSKPLGGLDNFPMLSREDARTPVKQIGAPPGQRAFSQSENEENDLGVGTPPRIFGSGPLASPISRLHTRNPFQRHASYETPFVPGSLSPQDRALSPASIALPSPTPSELESI